MCAVGVGDVFQFPCVDKEQGFYFGVWNYRNISKTKTNIINMKENDDVMEKNDFVTNIEEIQCSRHISDALLQWDSTLSLT